MKVRSAADSASPASSNIGGVSNSVGKMILPGDWDGDDFSGDGENKSDEDKQIQINMVKPTQTLNLPPLKIVVMPATLKINTFQKTTNAACI